MAHWKVTYQPGADSRCPASRMVGGIIFPVGKAVDVTDAVLIDAMADKPEFLVEKAEAPAPTEEREAARPSRPQARAR
jgi:hypothetical protein